MSRDYRMYVEVKHFNKNKIFKIYAAMRKEWTFDNLTLGKSFFNKGNAILGSGEGCLGGGESEERFAARLARAINKANGKICSVFVEETCLENLPYEIYIFDKKNPPSEEKMIV